MKKKISLQSRIRTAQLWTTVALFALLAAHWMMK